MAQGADFLVSAERCLLLGDHYGAAVLLSVFVTLRFSRWLVAQLRENTTMLDSTATRLNFEPFSLPELVQDVAQKFRPEATSSSA